MKSLSALDLAFFLAETEGSPKHVAGLLRFQKPPRAGANFVRKLADELRSFDRPVEPFNQVIHFAGLTGPHWRPCADFDIDQHVFYHRLPGSGSWAQVERLVARLHEPVMDRARPLWEYHLIDGIDDGGFAVYIRIHHSYADGMTMTSWLSQTLSTSARDRELKPVWAIPLGNGKRRSQHQSSLLKSVRELGAQSWSQVLTAGGMAKLASQQVLERAGITHKAVALQFGNRDRTPLTGSATPGRSIATAWLDMAEVKALGKSLRATLNHVALCCIDGAMHRHLEAIGYPVNHPLTVQMPVNLRREDHDKPGNMVGIGLVELGTPGSDPMQRLQEVGYSLRKVKDQIEGVPGDAVQQFTVISALTMEFIDKLKLTDRVPVTGHTLVSNVPGPAEPLYMKGAKLLQNYPLSILVPGLRMNITLLSCSGVLSFGLVATRDVKQLDKLARFIEEEFTALKKAAG